MFGSTQKRNSASASSGRSSPSKTGGSTVDLSAKQIRRNIPVEAVQASKNSKTPAGGRVTERKIPDEKKLTKHNLTIPSRINGPVTTPPNMEKHKRIEEKETNRDDFSKEAPTNQEFKSAFRKSSDIANSDANFLGLIEGLNETSKEGTITNQLAAAPLNNLQLSADSLDVGFQCGPKREAGIDFGFQTKDLRFVQMPSPPGVEVACCCDAYWEEFKDRFQYGQLLFTPLPEHPTAPSPIGLDVKLECGTGNIAFTRAYCDAATACGPEILQFKRSSTSAR